jgi:Zn-dependent protease with chaperone function
MRTLALLFCLLVLLVVTPSLLFLNLFQFSFHWSDALAYVLVAGVIYGLITAVGASLNRRFNTTVDAFLSGTSSDLAPQPGLLRTFGLLLFVLLPYLLFSLLFSVFIAITFGLYGLWGLTAVGRVPIAILIGLGIVVLGTAYAFFIGMYRLFFPPRPQTSGLKVTSEEQPEIWLLARKVAADVGTKPVDRIVITPDPGVSVHLEGSLPATLFGGGHRVLQIGIPSIHALAVNEFRAILAHEYGHFSNRDTQWSTFTYAMGNGLVAAFRATPGPLKQEDDAGGWIALVMALNPAYWTLLLFLKLFLNVTSAFSRIREVMADVRAMKLYGGESFRNGLARVAFNDAVFSVIFHGEVVPALAKENKSITDLSSTMDLLMAGLDDEKREEIKSSMANQEPSAYDSHPPIPTRLKYSERFAGGRVEQDKGETSALFHDWHALNEKIADLYNHHFKEYLRAIAAFQVATPNTTEAQEAMPRCPQCENAYNPGDYRADAQVIYCLACGTELPRVS